MKNALSVGTISESSSRGRVMSPGFKMDPKDKREVSTPSDSCQVDILICERWGGSLSCNGSTALKAGILAERNYYRLQQRKKSALGVEERSDYEMMINSFKN